MKRKFFKNNKGIAVITVMITIMFLAVIATATLYISTSNYAMKVANVYSKDNFYETDGYLVKTTTTIRNKIEGAEATLGGDIVETMPTDFGIANAGKYDINKIASYVDATASSGNIKVPNAYNTTKNDDIYIKSSNPIIIKEHVLDGDGNAISGLTRYTFKDIEVCQTAYNGHENSVKTDLVIDIQENAGSGGSAGGVGNMSMLLDSPISSTSADFKNLTMTGNSFIASYEDTKTLWTDGRNYFAPGKEGSAKGPGLLMTNESRLNLCGDNNVIYGDLVMTGNSSLAVYGNLTVYGDIKISNNATLILANGGELYQLLTAPLPGRSSASSVTAGANNVYPSTFSIHDVGVDKFTSFAETVGIVDTDIADRGLINKIFKKDFSTDFPGKRFIDLDPKQSPDSNKLKLQSVTGLDLQNDALNTNYMLKSDTLGMGKFGIGFIHDGTSTSSLNNNNANDALTSNYSHKLIICFNSSDVVLQQSTPYSTWLCKSPVSATKQHCVVLSKIGTNEFNYMTAHKGDTDSKIFDDDSNPFNHVKFSVQGKTFEGAIGDLFDGDCNVYVDKMFGYSLGGDGGSSTPSYDNTIKFTEYVRDFE